MPNYIHTDKQNGEGPPVADWNALSGALAGKTGLTLATENSADCVGIGFSNPAAKLHVNGWTKLGNANDEWIMFETHSGFHRISFKQLRFYDYSTGTDSLTIKNGNVGIGTDTPSAKLDINGNVAIKGHDLYLDNESRRDGQTGGSRRAFVHFMGDQLHTNHGGDYTGGVQISGKVGIGGAPGDENLKVHGTVSCTLLNQTSDVKFKKEVQPISNALKKVTELYGVNYQWKDAQHGTGLQMGLIAQEVEKVLPEIVATDDNGDKSIAYSQLTALLIEAVKELSNKLNQQQSEATA